MAQAAAVTGKTVTDWMDVIRLSRWSKRNEILEGLKKNHKLGHMHAQFLAGMFLNNGNPVYVDSSTLMEAHFAKAPHMRPLVDELIKTLLAHFKEARLIPKKTYLSFTDVREFAAVIIKPNEVRLGLDLGSEPMAGVLRKAVLAGPMPRFTHMLVLESKQQWNEQMLSLVLKSYERSHKK